MAFDPVTGEEIKEESAQYEPATGAAETSGQPMAQQQYDPMAVQQALDGGDKPGKKMFPIVAACVAVVVAAAVVTAVVVFAGGIFGSNTAKLGAAAANTFSEKPHIVSDLQNVSGILSQDRYTVGISCVVAGNEIGFEYIDGKEELQAVITADGSDIDSFQATASLDAERLALYAPTIDSRVLSYYYAQKNNGYLTEAMSESDLENINNLLESAYYVGSGTGDRPTISDLYEIWCDTFGKIDVKKAGSMECEVDGKQVMCSGYAFIIDSETAKSIAQAVNDKLKKDCPDYYEMLCEAAEADGEDFDEVFDGLMEDLDDMPDISLECYVYNSMLAAVHIESEDTEIDIAFKGGDYRTQNIEAVLKDGADETTIEIAGTESGSVEELVLSVDASEVFGIEYDYESGDFSIDVEDSGMEYTVEGTLQSTASEVRIVLDRVKTYAYTMKLGDYEPTFYMKKSADLYPLGGEEFDIGNADAYDFEELVWELEYEVDDSDFAAFIKMLFYYIIYGS